MSERVFGRYDIKRELGRGGMGSVYLAFDTHRQHDVALKLLPRTLLHEPGFAERFANEVRLIVSLEHAAIVPVYDFGEIDGQPYLAMRLMRGGSLADRIRKGPLPPDEIVTILRRIGSALDKAHEKNVVHRDLKPANILFDDGGNAYLADFGIARIAEGTQAMTVIGTPQYMSPEQAQGRPVNARTDVYQLGAVLYQMLTGKLPYVADTPTALMFKHVYDPVPSMARHGVPLPAGAQAVVEQAMAKDPNLRFASAGALSRAFSSVSGNASTVIMGPVAADTPTVVDTPPYYPPTPAGAATPTRPATRYDETRAGSGTPPPVSPPPSAPATDSDGRRFPLWQTLLGLIALLAVLGGGAWYFGVFDGGGLSAPEAAGNTGEGQTGAGEIVAPAATTVAPTEAPAATSTETPEQSRPGLGDAVQPLDTEAPIPDTPVPPTDTPQPPTSTPEPSATPTPDRGPEMIVYGNSVNKQRLEAVRLGNGETVILVVGGLHSGYAPSTVALAEELLDQYSDLGRLPTDVTLYVITNASPDSPVRPGERPGRVNANDVDLNRNFACDWSPEGTWRDEPISGGTAAFSEPETAALRDLIAEIEPAAVVFYEARARDGMVTPGECGGEDAGSFELANVYAESTGYPIYTEFVLTGDSTNWLAAEGIPAISILLRNYATLEQVDVATNISGIEAVLSTYAGR